MMNARPQNPWPGLPPHRVRAIVAAVTLWGLALGLVSVALATGQVGEPAADFSLQDTEGITHTLSGEQGRVVVLFMMGYG
jgi:hypothetical protein